MNKCIPLLALSSVLAFQPLAARSVAMVPSMPALELVQPGDNKLSCEALSTEINRLASSSVPAPAEKAKKKRGGLGFLGKALSSAAPMLAMAVPGVGALAASGVAQAMGSAASSSSADRQMDAAMRASEQALASMTPTPESLRKERLTALFDKKGC